MSTDNAAVRAVLDGSLFYEVVERTIRYAFTDGLRIGGCAPQVSAESPRVRELYEDWRAHGPGATLPGGRQFRADLEEMQRQAALDEREAALAEMRRRAEQRAVVFPCDLCGRSLQGEDVVIEHVLTEPKGIWHAQCYDGLRKYMPKFSGNGDGSCSD